MRILATKQNDNWTLVLQGAPAESVAEIRMQNTMNGRVEVAYVDVDADGNAAIATPQHFGQHTSFTATILTKENRDEVIDFTYTIAKPDRLVALASKFPAQPSKSDALNEATESRQVTETKGVISSV